MGRQFDGQPLTSTSERRRFHPRGHGTPLLTAHGRPMGGRQSQLRGTETTKAFKNVTKTKGGRGGQEGWPKRPAVRLPSGAAGRANSAASRGRKRRRRGRGA